MNRTLSSAESLEDEGPRVNALLAVSKQYVKCQRSWKRHPSYHGKSDISLLESGCIVGSVSCDGYHLPVGCKFTVDDAFNQGVLVCGRGAGQHPQLGPDLVQQVLLDLKKRMISYGSVGI